jgi:hypothetical protein
MISEAAALVYLAFPEEFKP